MGVNLKMRLRVKLLLVTIILSASLWFAYWELILSKILSQPTGQIKYRYKYLGWFDTKDVSEKLTIERNDGKESLDTNKQLLAGQKQKTVEKKDWKEKQKLQPKQRPFSLNISKLASDQRSYQALKQNSNNDVHVMILARMRTGSTLIGEIFNQNPNLFYLFEPLHTIDCYIRRGMMEEENRNFRSKYLLKNLNQCRFTNSYIDCFLAWGLGRFKSNVLYKMCQNNNRCRGITPESIENECNKYNNHFAMKFIRADLDMLKPLVTEQNMNVKIIHLIRDPRGTANSRKKYYNEMISQSKRHLANEHKVMSMEELGLFDKKHKLGFKVNTIESLCQWMRDTVGIATDRPNWLKNRYKMVRYEDMALDPIRITQEIYDFVGIDLPKSIIEWVKENTDVQHSTSENVKKMGIFSTHKNSTATATNWRKDIGIGEIKEIQNMCGDMMSLLGYHLVERQKDLKNPDYHVTEPLKLGADITIT